MALITINEPTRGIPLVVMDGAWITALRTATVSAIGAKYMARQPVRTVAIIGTGMQGRTHLLAFDAVLKPASYRVYDMNRAAAEAYCERMMPQTRSGIELCTSVQACTRGADVVVTATSAQKPFLVAAHLEPGAHVCAIGSYTEIAGDVIDWTERIVVDDREQTAHRGNLARFFATGRLSPGDIAATLGEVVAGKAEGRTYDDQNTLLVPIGMGSVDLAVAHVAYERALESGIGQWFDFNCYEELI
jgi:alanine dehydrogenase